MPWPGGTDDPKRIMKEGRWPNDEKEGKLRLKSMRELMYEPAGRSWPTRLETGILPIVQRFWQASTGLLENDRQKSGVVVWFPSC